MIRVGADVSRGFVWLAAACVCAGSALAAPVGPVVTTGSASYDPATLTVTSTTARTQISWRSFNLAPGEVVNFVLPGVQSTVLNQIFDARSLSLLGDLRSNGSVFLMSDGRVAGAGVNLDLSGTISASLRLPPLATALNGVASPDQPRPLTTLDEGSIYVLGQDAQALTNAGGEVMLNPGKTVELAHAGMPRLRVALTAPDAEAINLSRLIAGKQATGIFAGLFRVPAAARQAGRREADTVMTASAGDASDIERFYRYLVLYAQMRRGTEQPGRGLMQVAAVSNSPMFLPAAKSRPSVLPREIEIGASTTRPAAAETAQAPPALARAPEQEHELRLALAPAEPPAELVAMLAPQPAAVSATQVPERVSEPLLALAPAVPPAELVATLASRPMLALAPAEPPAESVAILAPRPFAPVAKHEPEHDAEFRLALAPAAPPAELVATLAPQPMLALAPAEPPAEMVASLAHRTDAVIVEIGPERGRDQVRRAPAITVVAFADARAHPVAQQESQTREIRIERRAPRYFTDYRGAMFFM